MATPLGTCWTRLISPAVGLWENLNPSRDGKDSVRMLHSCSFIGVVHLWVFGGSCQDLPHHMGGRETPRLSSLACIHAARSDLSGAYGVVSNVNTNKDHFHASPCMTVLIEIGISGGLYMACLQVELPRRNFIGSPA